jgi:hypothetical protein
MSDADCIFLDEAGILVSKTRFVVGAQTFTMSSVSSVRGVEISPNRTMPILLMLIGLFMSIFGVAAFSEVSKWVGVAMCLFGIASTFIAIVTLRRQKPEFVVMLMTASGEMAACGNTDRDFIARVLDALTEVIIVRG